MDAAESEFRTYLENNEHLIKSVVMKIGLSTKEDFEDLIAEGQRILWTIFISKNKTGPKSLIRAIIYNRLMDYLRQTLPLSRTHLLSIKNGECANPTRVNEKVLELSSSSSDPEIIDLCVDATIFIQSDIFSDHHRLLFKMMLEKCSDAEIMRELGLTISSLHVYKWELRKLFEDNYSIL